MMGKSLLFLSVAIAVCDSKPHKVSEAISNSHGSRRWHPSSKFMANPQMYALNQEQSSQEPIHLFATKADGDKEKDKEEQGDDKQKVEKSAGEEKDQKELVKMWFTWPFWRLLVYCSVCLLLFTELITPLALAFIGRTLLLASTLFFIQNFAFLCTAIAFVTPGAAGATLCLVISVILCALSLLIFLGVVGWRFQGQPTKSIELLQVDLTYIFKPVSIFVIVFLIIQGLVDSSGSDWGEVAMFGSFLALGLAFASSGVITDMLSYLFIRSNDYFHEDEFIDDGDLLQIKRINWCYTLAYRPATRSDVYINNGGLLGGAVNNRSRDNSRASQIDLDIPIEKSEKIILAIQALFKQSDEKGFASITGKKFDGQIDPAKSQIYISAMDPGGDTCTMTIKLFGKYWFSKPEQWKIEEGTPPPARQLEWQAGWNYQVEWLLLEAKKVISNA